MVPLNELITKRRSPRAFSNEMIEAEKISALFEAARLAASSYNEQPWRFIYATKNEGEAYAKILATLKEANKLWAKNAPLLVLSIAKTNYSINGSPNKHAWHDLGLAMGNLSLQATDSGLFLHQMGGFDAEKAIEMFNIPEGYEPVTVFAVGYLGKPDILPENLKRIEENPQRTRKALEEIAFAGTWNGE